MSKKPKSIINDPSHAVEDFVQGLCWQYPHRLIKLQNHNVLLLRSPLLSSSSSDDSSNSSSTRRVQLLSGGGSGHEPSHAGWIGTGMLRGAICGGMFASPSVASILAAIRAAAATSTERKTASSDTNPVLLIVKNYTGDRLNFGLACERANNEGLVCDMVVIADDVALPRTKGITGARGVAGTVLLNKIAGAAAAQRQGGMTLAKLKDLIQATAACLGTLGMALDSVTVPGAATINDRLHDDSIMEVGLGIHGEAGLRQSKIMTAQEMAKEMIETIQSYGRVVKKQQGNAGEGEHVVPMFEAGDELALLINNLGGTSNFEMSILAKGCVETAEALGAKVSRVYVGSYMTSFNMHGASLTILNLTAAPSGVAEYLDAPTDAPAWTPCEVWKPTNATDIRPSLKEWDVTGLSSDAAETIAAPKLPPLAIASFGSISKKLVEAAARALIEQEALLTKYDTIVGDGDCGITMKRGATQVLSAVEQQDTSAVDHPVTLFAALADAVSSSMGGTSGVLLELMFRKISSTLARCDDGTSIGAVELAHAFEAGVNAVSLYGGATVGARTMLDALVPAAVSLVQASLGGTAANLFQLAAEQARQGADQTATMAHASAGRSNYLSEETLTGTPDPGAVAVAVVFEALAKSLVQ